MGGERNTRGKRGEKGGGHESLTNRKGASCSGQQPRCFGRGVLEQPTGTRTNFKFVFAHRAYKRPSCEILSRVSLPPIPTHFVGSNCGPIARTA
jgi:hypothetical protein